MDQKVEDKPVDWWDVRLSFCFNVYSELIVYSMY